jgi:ribokinase
VAARRLGGEVRLIGCVGDDADGRRISRSLADAGIGVEGLVTSSDTATGTALITVDTEGRNQIAVAPGANHHLTVEMVSPFADSIAWADVVVCQLETPLPVVRWALGEARRRDVVTVLNPAPVQPLDPEILALVDFLTPNEHEAARLTGLAVDSLASAREAAERLLASGAGSVLVTLGEGGVLACYGDNAVHFPAFSVQAVDTTAAGDAFNGALALGLAAGGTLEQAIPLASAAAALACTKRGAQDSLPVRAEVEAFLRSLGQSR